MVRLAIRVARDQAEVVLAELIELAPGGVEEVQVGRDVIEYAVYGAPGELPALPDLRAAAGAALVEVSTSEIPDDWHERWRAFHRPVEVGGRLTVRPPWEARSTSSIDLVIDPGQAFGTGAHATTRLCLELMLGLEASGEFVDLGCGSGVLALAAARLGWAPVVALDNDEACLEATRANARANGVAVEVRRHDLRVDPPAIARTVAANLLAPLLLAWAERLDRRARPADRRRPAHERGRSCGGGLRAAGIGRARAAQNGGVGGGAAGPRVMADLRARLSALVGLEVPDVPELVVHGERRREGYLEHAVSYGAVPALLLAPEEPSGAAVLVHHQHSAQWHLGKSEVAGLAGDRWQAFGPALARRGVTVLAPDAIGFEDRRRGGPGTDERASDGNDYFATMGHRLVQGRPLMGSVLTDAAAGHGVLSALSGVDPARVGVLGHSMGGATALWQAALDERINFVAASGCACTYRDRIAHGVGIEAAQAVPGVLELGDLDAVASLVAPRPLLIASADGDKYSRDAPAIVEVAARAYEALGAGEALRHDRAHGGHALTPERFAAIVDWVAARA